MQGRNFAGSGTQGELVVLSGARTGLRLPLSTRPHVILLGREPDCTLQFDPVQDRLVGRRHAQVEVRPDGVFLVDLNSRNGTFLQALPVHQPRALRDGDRIMLGEGGPEIEVRLDAPSRVDSTLVLELDVGPARRTVPLAASPAKPASAYSAPAPAYPAQTPAYPASAYSAPAPAASPHTAAASQPISLWNAPSSAGAREASAPLLRPSPGVSGNAPAAPRNRERTSVAVPTESGAWPVQPTLSSQSAERSHNPRSGVGSSGQELGYELMSRQGIPDGRGAEDRSTAWQEHGAAPSAVRGDSFGRGSGPTSANLGSAEEADRGERENRRKRRLAEPEDDEPAAASSRSETKAEARVGRRFPVDLLRQAILVLMILLLASGAGFFVSLTTAASFDPTSSAVEGEAN